MHLLERLVLSVPQHIGLDFSNFLEHFNILKSLTITFNNQIILIVGCFFLNKN